MPFLTYAQVIDYVGGGVRSLANISSVIEGEWSLFNNPAGLNDESSLNFDGTRLYGLDLKSFAFGYAHAAPSYGLAIGSNFFGNKYLSQSRFFISGSKSIKNTSIGLRLSLLQFSLQGQPTIWKPYLDIGGIVKISPPNSGY